MTPLSRPGPVSRRPRRTGALAFAVACLLVLAAAPGALAASPRVIGGTPADFASMAAILQHNQPDAFQAQFCGGTVIAPTLVVTAAHCFSDIRSASQVDVLTGTSVLGSGGQRIPVARIDREPAWNSALTIHDIVVLHLASPTSAPAATLATPADAALARPGRVATIYGWGKDHQNPDLFPTHLLGAQVPILSTSRCDVYGSYLPSLGICAVARGKDACQGDSGGPLVVDNGAGVPVLVGLVSYGTEQCANLQGPTVYTRITSEAAFLNAELNGLPLPPAPKPKRYSGRTAQGQALRFTITGDAIARVLTFTRDRCRRGRPLVVTQNAFGQTVVDHGRFVLTAGSPSQPAVLRGVITGRTAHGTLTDRSLRGRTVCTASTRWTARL